MGCILCQYLEKQHKVLYSRAMNAIGLALSFVFIGVVIGIALLIKRFARISAESVRKFIHIGVSNWWFILLWWFDSLGYALVGPIVFIIANGVAVHTGAADVLGISDRRRNQGLVYFPISLSLLVVAGFLEVLPMWACGMGVLTMGYGDGLAALLGKRWGVKKIRGGKSVVGTIVMFIVAMVVVLGFSVGYRLDGLWSLSWWGGLAVTAAAAALLEAYTPYGLDNLSVPLGTAVIAAVVFGV